LSSAIAIDPLCSKISLLLDHSEDSYLSARFAALQLCHPFNLLTWWIWSGRNPRMELRLMHKQLTLRHEIRQKEQVKAIAESMQTLCAELTITHSRLIPLQICGRHAHRLDLSTAKEQAKVMQEFYFNWVRQESSKTNSNQICAWVSTKLENSHKSLLSRRFNSLQICNRDRWIKLEAYEDSSSEIKSLRDKLAKYYHRNPRACRVNPNKKRIKLASFSCSFTACAAARAS
jgi:hypothetical protein